ncbi:MAG: hypothetical protein GX234_10210 [Clostridiales bacterium]|nr:hypothetical protein [Clostridiales bacterium]
MTSTFVKGVSLFAETPVGGTKASGKSDAFTDCFTEICSKNQEGQRGKDANLVKTGSTGTRTDSAVHKSLRNKTTAEVEDTKEAVAEDSAEEKIYAAADQIIAAIADQLGMTIEQVQEAMQKLQINPEELLSADGIRSLMVALSGGEDQVNLLTDEVLYQSVKEVTKTLENVMSELQEQTGMSAEELEAMIVKMAEKSHLQKVENPADTVMQMPEQSDVVPEAEKRMPVVEVRQESQMTNGTDSLRQTEQTQPDQAKKRTETGDETKDDKKGNDSKNGFLQQMDTQTAKAELETLVSESQGNSQSVSTEQIMKQIMDYMKVQVKADMTQMEIQLHPASLGNIHIQIAAKEGVITAQITAQNEAVKTALESQIVQLKESLNEQGIKVEAVEVTIASHEFERNLEQNQSEGRHAQSEEKKSGRRMNLNLTGMEESEMEKMEEAQKIAADMMVRNGNTVDFSA